MVYKFCPFIKDECNPECVFFKQTSNINECCVIYKAVNKIDNNISYLSSIETNTGDISYINTTLNTVESILKDHFESED